MQQHNEDNIATIGTVVASRLIPICFVAIELSAILLKVKPRKILIIQAIEMSMKIMTFCVRMLFAETMKHLNLANPLCTVCSLISDIIRILFEIGIGVEILHTKNKLIPSFLINIREELCIMLEIMAADIIHS